MDRRIVLELCWDMGEQPLIFLACSMSTPIPYSMLNQPKIIKGGGGCFVDMQKKVSITHHERSTVFPTFDHDSNWVCLNNLHVKMSGHSGVHVHLFCVGFLFVVFAYFKEMHQYMSPNTGSSNPDNHGKSQQKSILGVLYLPFSSCSCSPYQIHQ